MIFETTENSARDAEKVETKSILTYRANRENSKSV